ADMIFFQEIHSDCIYKTNIRGCISLPYLPDDTFHSFYYCCWFRSAIIYREFYKHQVRIKPKGMLFQPKYTEVRSATTYCGIYFNDFRLRIFGLKPFLRIDPPTLLGCNAPTKIRHANGVFVLQRQTNIGQPIPD